MTTSIYAERETEWVGQKAAVLARSSLTHPLRPAAGPRPGFIEHHGDEE